MGFNFDNENCKSSTSLARFGICDDQDDTPAYIDSNDEEKWICICSNPDELSCVFTAIDHCIEVLRESGELERRCDGALEYLNHIIFLELKRVRTAGWIKDGIDQLEVTVNKFFESKDLKDFGKKRAVLANSKRPFFHYGQQERMEDFRSKTGVRLIISNNILIK